MRRLDRSTPHGGERAREGASAEWRAARTCPRWSRPHASPPPAGAPSPRGIRHPPSAAARTGPPTRAGAFLPIPRRNRALPRSLRLRSRIQAVRRVPVLRAGRERPEADRGPPAPRRRCPGSDERPAHRQSFRRFGARQSTYEFAFGQTGRGGFQPPFSARPGREPRAGCGAGRSFRAGRAQGSVRAARGRFLPSERGPERGGRENSTRPSRKSKSVPPLRRGLTFRRGRAGPAPT